MGIIGGRNENDCLPFVMIGSNPQNSHVILGFFYISCPDANRIVMHLGGV